MTKTEFVGKIAETTGFTKVDADKAVNAFLETVTEALKSGEKVTFTGFGSFEVIEREAREGATPRQARRCRSRRPKRPSSRPARP